MFSIFSSGGMGLGCGAISPFGSKYLTSAVPSDSPSVYSVVIGRQPAKVNPDLSEIHINVVPAEYGSKRKTLRRKAAVKRP